MFRVTVRAFGFRVQAFLGFRTWGVQRRGQTCNQVSAFPRSHASLVVSCICTYICA